MTRKPATALIRRRWSAAAFVFFSLLNTASWIVAQSPYATELIAENAAYGGASLYNDPHAVLGEPTRIAVNNDPLAGSGTFHTSLIQAALNQDPAGNNVIATLSRKSDGAGGFVYGSITVKFDHPVLDDPANPYGIDLNVFGNSFYAGGGTVSDTTDMRSYNLAGTIFAEPVVISVSSDNIHWYTYSNGPFGDTAFPTQGYAWSAAQQDATGNGWTNNATDFTKPVNPALNTLLATSSLAAADAMGTYVGSGGGTGIDLAPSGFASIQYVRVESTTQFRDGEIDAFADVRPALVGESLSITPDNVAAATKLYFQNPQMPAHAAVVAQFTATSDLAELASGPVTNSSALAALPSGNLLASYKLDVSPLIGAGTISMATNYQLSPGPTYTGNGASLDLLDWNGSAWDSVTHTFDTLTGRLVVSNWTDDTATFAILDTATMPPGDFNGDGRVDAADYVAARKTFSGASFLEQYAVWRAHFGQSQGSGADHGLGMSTIPEPTAFALALCGVIVTVSLCAPRR